MTYMPKWASVWVARWKQHALFVFGACALVLYSYPAWILPGIPGTDDLSNLNVPQRQLLGWFYRHGHWPLWNPFNFAGQPLLAAGQSGPLYFPNVVFVLLPIVGALKISYIFHLLLLSVGMYCLSWFVTKHRWASFLSTIAFADSGFFVGHQIHTQMFDSMCWLPLVFWMFLRLQQQFTWRRLAAFALAFAGQVFAGHPQVIFYTVLFSLLYAVLMWCWRPTWQGIKQISWGLSGMALGALTASAQLMPTLQLIGYSDRSNVSSGFLLQGSLPASGLLQFLLPFSFGGGYTQQPFSVDQYKTLYHAANFWEYLPFIGIVFLCLAIATTISRFVADSVVRTLSIIGAFMLLLALGQNTFFSYILTDVPGFDMFRVPARYIGLADFSIALLMGIGVAHLSSAKSPRFFRRSFTLIPLGFIVILILVKFFGPYENINKLGFWIPMAELVIIFLLALFQQRRTWHWPMRTLGTAAVIGLVFQTTSLSPFVDWNQGVYASTNALVKYLKGHLSGTYPFTRIASIGTVPLQKDRSASWQIPELNGYDSLVPTWYVNKINLTWGSSVLFDEPRQFVDALGVKYLLTDATNSPALSSSALGTTSWMHWIPNLQGAYALRVRLSSNNTITGNFSPLFSVTLKSGGREFTQQISGWPALSYIINIPNGWPKTSPTQVTIRSQNWSGTFSLDALQILSPSKTTTMVIHQLFGPRIWKPVMTFDGTTIWKNTDTLHAAWIASPSSPLNALDTAAHLKSWQPNRQVWEVNAKYNGIFVLSQTYDPSWSATVDGHTVGVKKAADLLTSVPVTRGTHRVTLTYEPRSFEAGLGTTAIALIFILFLLVFPPRRRLTTNLDDKD